MLQDSSLMEEGHCGVYSCDHDAEKIVSGVKDLALRAPQWHLDGAGL